MTQSSHTSHTKAISPLRQRMIEDMSLRKLKPRTQEDYIRSVKKLTRFLGHSPHTATAEDLRQFQLFMTTHGDSTSTINSTISGLRFFFDVTLDEPKVMKKMSAIYQPRKIPVVLSQQEIKQLLEATARPRRAT